MGRAAGRIEEYKAQRKNPKGPEKRLYTVPEAAAYMGRTVDGLRELIWKGRLPIIKEGRRVHLDVRDLDIYIESSKTRFTY